MRYDEKSQEIELGYGELVELSLLRLASEAAAERGEVELTPLPITLPGGRVRSYSFPFEEGGHRFRLVGEAYAVGHEEERVLVLARAVPSDPALPDRTLLRRARGELFCAAFLDMQARGTGEVRAQLILSHPASGRESVREEEIKRAEAERFFLRLKATLSHAAREEVARVSERMPTLRTLPFPYPAERESQREMMQSVYRAIRRSERLYVCAPTGTGKTAAVLYPALRALGAGYGERVFYLTPKTTTALAAADALRRFSEAGGRLRAVLLSAKERLCPEGLLCRDPRTPCRRAHTGGAREEEAALALLASSAVPISSKEILAAANEYGVCPYELSLRYSMFCDVIIADYNYLFDTRVRLRRYFEQGGDFCFLIDEAHDLLERVRECYSVELSDKALSDLAALCAAEAPADFARKTEELCALFRRALRAALHGERIVTDRAGVNHIFAAQKQPPEHLLRAVTQVSEEGLRLAVDRRLPLALRMTLRELLYPLRDFAVCGELYSARYESFYFQDGEVGRIRLVCLDPSEIIDRHLSLGRSAVLFSATLTPLSYYRTVLGGAHEGKELVLDSPFDEAHLSVAVMDRISTRFAAREESAPAIAEAIAAMVGARTGNYLVFCPSFAYMKTVRDAFCAAYPHVDTVMQERGSAPAMQRAFLSRFREAPKKTLVGFSVTGGIYAEGIDLAGSRLIGAAVVGVSLPQPSPERDAICAYYDDVYEAGKEYAYMYPGMNRVLQAAGRVIRSEEDRGVLLLIDDRFATPLYRRMLPSHWRQLKLVGDARAVAALFSRFWKRG